MFSKASWLERIHHNGGRPIYADAGKINPRASVRRREKRAGFGQPIDRGTPSRAPGTRRPLAAL